MRTIGNRGYEKMVKVCLDLPPKLLEAIDLMIEKGVYSSRAEAIRDAVRWRFGGLGYLGKASEQRREPPAAAKDPRNTSDARKETRCAEFEKVCEERPYVCYSKALAKEYAKLHGIRCMPQVAYRYGFSEDFLKVLAKDVAAHALKSCLRRIGVKPANVATVAGLPRNHPVNYVVSLALSLLPCTEWRTSAAVKYICDCKVLKDYACDAGLATVRFAYYAMRKDLGAAAQFYEMFKHCVQTR